MANSGMHKMFKELSVKKLYKDLLLLARFYGQRQDNEKALVNSVRLQFKANMLEVDDAKIEQQKEAAIRALHNVHLHEAERYVKNKAPKAPSIPFMQNRGPKK
mmetsp:Transcript_21061/g.35909  ORF Transcript_21061/g.35909 Transcript_21061/m.35909 type:complete len:103 (-) Transcript_21061:1005-1313(-)|eukprot:CAMPEP_0119107246 /NCGR_PEP_ID=MMETSP1180-20130426/9596_1 /TAXON_ID=3052 ORGANISM="Chlamydomonas cf sp, Strain CCMP681" /NCGR_SAMPLE_ID=MMETSP1180 /ASSEMBLY_ACC=CAM_ASM_000741 /LENGTH=102 /DNA_ID=CAMNT_0007092707 /DNA_START=118 /DNA_END=426 /DNA_ORIENTATION=-